MKIKYFKKGFTLIELLIVIAIIAILSAIIIVSYANAQKKSRDNKRRADLQSIASAFQIYHQEKKLWLISGTGASGGGQGYYGLESATSGYAKSVAHGLEEGGYLNPAPLDPQFRKSVTSGCISSSGGCTMDYMVYACGGAGGTGVSISGVLENPVQSEIDETAKSCNGSTVPPGNANSVDLRYGNTYSVTIH